MLKQIRHITLGIMLALFAFSPGNALATPGKIGQVGHEIRTDWNGQSQSSISRVDTQYAQRKPQRRISASQAKSAAMRKVRGAKFVNVKLVNQGTYRVRLQQKNGRIVDVYVDAYSGRVNG